MTDVPKRIPVLFVCPRTREHRLARHLPVMSLAEFEHWRADYHVPKAVDCACEDKVHWLVTEDYFLTGTPPPGRGN